MSEHFKTIDKSEGASIVISESQISIELVHELFSGFGIIEYFIYNSCLLFRFQWVVHILMLFCISFLSFGDFVANILDSLTHHHVHILVKSAISVHMSMIMSDGAVWEFEEIFLRIFKMLVAWRISSISLLVRLVLEVRMNYCLLVLRISHLLLYVMVLFKSM